MKKRFRKFSLMNSWLLLIPFICSVLSLIALIRLIPKSEPKKSVILNYSNRDYYPVTKSLKEFTTSIPNPNVLFANFVPHSGYQILLYLLEKMQTINNYKHYRIKGPNIERQLQFNEQEDLVDLLYDQMRKNAVPMTFDSLVYFTNFTQFQKQPPTFINLIRNPNKITTKNGTLQTNLIYFCGHDSMCSTDFKWALQKAQNNVEKFYSVVGILEDIETTLKVLQKKLPYFFKGVLNYYQMHLSHLVRKSNPRSKLAKENYRSEEVEFYKWIRARLVNQLFKL